MTKKKIIVCFIGTDGSGKSTLVLRAFNKIRMRGTKVRKTYGRFEPVFSKLIISLGRRLFLKEKNMFSDYDRYLNSKQAVYRRTSKLVRIYFCIILFEYYIQVLFKIIIPYKFLGYSIISDRYVHDTIVNDLAVDGSFSVAAIRKLLSDFWFFVPKPDLTFYVKVPVEVAFKRKQDIPSLSYLQIRNRLYEQLASGEKLIVLDGTLDILELEKSIFDMIDNL
jgi:dTMP kinase